MRLYELLMGLKYSLYGLSGLEEITSPVTDSRRAERGSLFICLVGTRRNGHRFAGEAIAAGAAALVCETYISGAPCVLTEDTRLAAAVIWYNYYGCPAQKMRLFAVTGTNGKTSTAAFLSSIIRKSGLRCATLGTFGAVFDGRALPFGEAEVTDVPAAMTTPDPEYLYGALSDLEQRGADAAVIEVSSHALLQKKTVPLCFECGIFTNLSPEHLDIHGDMETYFSVKASLFGKCRTAVTNADDSYGKRIRGIRCGLGCTDNVSCTSEGVSYVLHHRGRTLNISTRIAGCFTVYNTMLAAVAALETGFSDECVREGISAVNSICGRMEHIAARAECGIDIFIDYAHTPKALEAALKSLGGGSRAGGSRLCAVFGCGGDRDREKRPLMGLCAHKNCDRVIVTSDNPRTENKNDIINDILDGIPDRAAWAVIPDRAEAIAYAVETAAEGEIILLAGKGHEDYETGPDGKTPFSEREIAEMALKRKLYK